MNFKNWQSQQIPLCLPNSDEDFTNITAKVQGYGKTEYGTEISNHYQHHKNLNFNTIFQILHQVIF